MKTIQLPDATTEDRTAGIARVLEELVSEFDGGWVTFESKGSDRVVEVAFDHPHFALNIPHAEAHGLLPKLQEAGFSIPASWVVKQDKKKGFFSSGFLEVEVDQQALKELAAFIRRFVRDFLRWPEEEGLSASLQQ